MKIKITNKKAMQYFNKIINCNELVIARYIDDNITFYNCGFYGWNYDLINFEGVGIITNSYRNTPKITIRPPYELKQKYNEKFEEMTKDTIRYSEKQEIAKKLMNNFINEDF